MEQVKPKWRRGENVLLSLMDVVELGQGLTRSVTGGDVNSRPLCSNARHWETHSDTFTYSHTGTERMLLPTTTTQTLSGISRDGPISSLVLGVQGVTPSP